VAAVRRRRVAVLAPILPRFRLPVRALLLLPPPKLLLPSDLRPWFARPSRPRLVLPPRAPLLARILTWGSTRGSGRCFRLFLYLCLLAPFSFLPLFRRCLLPLPH
jgi:hypothetical protein